MITGRAGLAGCGHTAWSTLQLRVTLMSEASRRNASQTHSRTHSHGGHTKLLSLSLSLWSTAGERRYYYTTSETIKVYTENDHQLDAPLNWLILEQRGPRGNISSGESRFVESATGRKWRIENSKNHVFGILPSSLRLPSCNRRGGPAGRFALARSLPFEVASIARTPAQSLYVTLRSPHPQCTFGIQSVSRPAAAATLPHPGLVFGSSM